MNPQLTRPFFYAACQHGAESVLKKALCEPAGPFRIAYSSRGLLTFKTDMPLPVWTRALPEHPMLRARGIVLEKLEGSESAVLIDQLLGAFSDLDWQSMHVWQRDPSPVGWRGFAPGNSVLAAEVAREIRQRLRASGDARPVLAHGLEPDSPLSSDKAPQRVLELILDTPSRWWIAAKRTQRNYDTWPGGVPMPPVSSASVTTESSQEASAETTEDDPVSRAYGKIAEAFAWSELTLRPGEHVVEIGSAPGGACQWLLEAGAHVTGIDPGEMDPRILAHPRFTHWRGRSLQFKRAAFRPFRIIVCDANVTPNYTLDTVESIVMYPTSRVRGLILTMKLPEWEHSELIPEHLERVRSWGFETVQARQLASNRREYCLFAKRKLRSKPSADLPSDPHLDPNRVPPSDASPDALPS